MRLRLLLLAALAALVAACARHVETSVTRFHENHLPVTGGFTVVPAEPAMEGPEFNQYAGLIREEMTRYGYRPAEDAADLRVAIDYGVSEGRTKITTRPGHVYPTYGYYVGFHHHPYYYGFYDPFYYDGYLGPDIRTQTVYTRSLGMRIESVESGQVLFEGRAVSEGPTQEISLIMPYLVESMFRNFPGESGATKIVEIETRDGKRY